MKEYLPVIVTLLTVISNSLGGNIKEISAKYIKSNSITPAPFTFSIWGLIYSLLLYATFIYHKEIFNGNIFSLFIISAILSATWIQVWGKNLVLSSVILLLLAASLIMITYELNKNNVNKILLYTFGIYTTWAIIASIINLSTTLIENDIIDNKSMKTIILIILSILPFVFNKFFNKTILAMLLTIIWASFGIIMKDTTNNLIFIIPILISLIFSFII
uniref:Tryptophan-rich sensory protein n=1 Tax=viral metagenome TaxID=1070528 RepID=A0A6C0HUV7_9ZZZZ